MLIPIIGGLVIAGLTAGATWLDGREKAARAEADKKAKAEADKAHTDELAEARKAAAAEAKKDAELEFLRRHKGGAA